eukprot:3318997-Amphidinium_carterae.1
MAFVSSFGRLVFRVVSRAVLRVVWIRCRTAAEEFWNRSCFALSLVGCLFLSSAGFGWLLFRVLWRAGLMCLRG